MKPLGILQTGFANFHTYPCIALRKFHSSLEIRVPSDAKTNALASLLVAAPILVSAPAAAAPSSSHEREKRF